MEENFNFNTPLSSMRLQAQLGKEVKRMYKEGDNVVRLSLARVTKVNYKYNTVDVITTLHKNTTTKNPSDNGKHSARLPVSFGGVTPSGKPYGTNTLVTVGTLVLIGFLEGSKDLPIVINIYNDVENQSQLTKTTLTSADESEEKVQRELWQLFTLYPSMTYKNIDGRGNQEVTFSGKSFMYITDTDPDNAYVQDAGFDYQDLPSSYYANGDLIEPLSPKSPTLLYVHQGVYDKHRVTFFIKSDGTLRVGSKHLEGEGITYQETKTDGTYSITQKRDTANPEEESVKFSKVEIQKDGKILLQGTGHKLEVTEDGIFVDGKPISSIGGGEGNTDLSGIIKAIGDVNTSISIIDGKIETKVSKMDYKIDDKEIQETSRILKEEIQSRTGDIKTSLASLKKYVDDTMYDKVISDLEKSLLSQYTVDLDTKKLAFLLSYKKVSDSAYLTETEKAELTAKKTSYENAHEDLLLSIDLAFTDGKILSGEAEEVSEKFDGYSTALDLLINNVNTSIDNITKAKIKEAASNPLNFLNGESRSVSSNIVQLADSIKNKVESETFTKVVQDLDSKKASVEETKAISDKVKEVQESVEKQTPYVTNIISTNGTIFKNGVISTTLFCNVYKGTENVTNTLPNSAFVWSRVSDDEAGDTKWNEGHLGVGKAVSIDSDDVTGRATFTCDIYIDNP